MIRSKRAHIGEHSHIADDADILTPGGFHVGKCCHIGRGVKIHCWEFRAGDYLYLEDGAEVGRGGCFSSAESRAVLGDAVFLGTRAVLNPNCQITVGDGAGIGAEVGVWTHGAYPSVLEGYPVTFAPVSIGKGVWLTGHSQVLPGVTIGDGAVISMQSLVNKDIPPYALAGGVPARVLRDDVRRPVDAVVVADIIPKWEKSARWRGLEVPADVLEKFDFRSLQVRSELSPVEEDFRDFLRRYGIRFLTGQPFQSIPHPEMVKCST
jgi:acetyltransferase-like isoleucine patch superfamily enzyme